MCVFANCKSVAARSVARFNPRATASSRGTPRAKAVHTVTPARRYTTAAGTPLNASVDTVADTNDIGFMQRTDIISGSAVVMYTDQRTARRTRERNVWFGAWNNRNFDGDTLEEGVFADWFVTTTNYLRPRVALYLVADLLARWPQARVYGPRDRLIRLVSKTGGTKSTIR